MLIQLKETTDEETLLAAFGPRASGRMRLLLAQFRMITAEVDGELAGAILVQMINPVLADVHISVMPQFRGQMGRRIGKEWLQYIWDHTTAQRVTGAIRSDNTLAIRYAKAMGMTQYGYNERSLFWQGILHDTVLMGVTRVSA